MGLLFLADLHFLFTSAVRKNQVTVHSNLARSVSTLILLDISTYISYLRTLSLQETCTFGESWYWQNNLAKFTLSYISFSWNARENLDKLWQSRRQSASSRAVKLKQIHFRECKWLQTTLSILYDCQTVKTFWVVAHIVFLCGLK